MSRAINMGDTSSEALRSLLMQRSFSKAGLAVNSTTNTYTVTIGGTPQIGDTVTVNVLTEAGLVTGAFEVTVLEDTTDKIATALELVVEALVGVASSAAGSVITVTPATTTEAIVVTAAVTGTEPTTTVAVAETIIGAKGFKTANTIVFGVNGHMWSQTTQTNLALTGAVIPVGSFKWWLVTINTSGTLAATPGTNNVAELPAIPADQAVVGAIKVVTDATHTFTPGVTGLSAAGITDTYYDLSCVPAAGVPA